MLLHVQRSSIGELGVAIFQYRIMVRVNIVVVVGARLCLGN